MAAKSVLLILGGGVAAYKSLELIRLLRREDVGVRCVMTRSAAQFVTPLSVAALSGGMVHQELFSLIDEQQMGHIELSRSADLVVVAPATADLMAKAAHGLADDLASTVLLATDKPVLMAPAMNVRMWEHPATRRNRARLADDGVAFVGPDEGAMACGEYGFGRMAEPTEIFRAALAALDPKTGSLRGLRALVTAGPTLEPIDPVRFVSNRSSGLQGYAIAQALALEGADVVLVSGPTHLAAPVGVRRMEVETAAEMMAASQAALPVDVAVMVAAVADWRPRARSQQKLKKTAAAAEVLDLTPTVDILAALSVKGPRRPRLVVGFAAETESLDEHAEDKRRRKGCDWIVGNDVSGDVMGGPENCVSLYRASGVERWPRAAKVEIARRLVGEIAATLAVAP